jgi:hypothetical protein
MPPADSHEFPRVLYRALLAVCVERCPGQRLLVCAPIVSLWGDCPGWLPLAAEWGKAGTPVMALPSTIIPESARENELTRTENPMRVLIAVIAGPHQGEVFTFAGHDTFLVGRSKRAHFRLP